MDNEINFPVTIEKRCSQDLQVNSYGTSLLELCIGNNLIALNGRTRGHFLGQFTCYTYNGASVNNCPLCYRITYDIQSSIINFSIGNIDEFSHHCCLSFVMRVNIPELSRDDISLTPHPTSFVWNANMRNM